jgi:DNA polymerase
MIHPAPILFLDIETSSACDISRGAWAYSEHPSTVVFCVVFHWMDFRASQDTPTKRLVWTDGPVPKDVADHVGQGLMLCPHNWSFEFAIWHNILVPCFGFPRAPARLWLDTQAFGMAFNLPPALEGLANALGTTLRKDTEGAALMKTMAKAKPVEGEPGVWTYDRDLAHLERLTAYCQADVSATWECFRRLPAPHPFEAKTWRVDQKINLRGVYLDQPFAQKMITMAELRKEQLQDAATRESGGALNNLRSVPKLKAWVKEHGIVLPVTVKRNTKGEMTRSESLSLPVIERILEAPDVPLAVRAVLSARAEIGKLTSLAKLVRAAEMVGSDGRLRNALHYCGALTGRWSSSGFQVHNLPKPKLGPVSTACVRQCVEMECLELLCILQENPLQALSQILRSIIIAAPGYEFLAADFSAIEARIVAWLAGQMNIVDLFAAGEDVYTHAANLVGSDSRPLGKVLTLANGYGMGPVKFHGKAAEEGVHMELKEARAFTIGWRANNQEIVQFWRVLEDAVYAALDSPGVGVNAGSHIQMLYKPNLLRVFLPSGRAIVYHRPHIVHTVKEVQTVNEDGEVETLEIEGPEIRFWTVAKNKASMATESTYGGKLAENVTQGTARDILSAALQRFDKADKYPVVIHVHDSMAAEVPEGTGSLQEFEATMAESPDWAKTLPIKAEGYRSRRFSG